MRRVLSVREDDHRLRRHFIAVVALLRIPISLIIDDAEDLVGGLSKICRSERSKAIVAAAWAMQPTWADMALFTAMPSVVAFRQSDRRTLTWVHAEIEWRYATGS